MPAPTASALFNTTGQLSYGANDARAMGVYRCRSAAFAASATAALALQLPANARVISAQANPSTAVVLATATRYGVGTSADPDAILISGTTTTAGTAVGPVPYVTHIPIFSNSIAGTAGGVSSTAAFTLSTFSGQTVAPIPANFLKPGDIIRMRGSGTIAWGTDGTFILKVLSGTDIVIQGATITPVDGDMFSFDVDMTIRAIGSSGTFVSGGRTYTGTAGSAAGAADVSTGGFLASTALDTTAAFTPTVTGIFSTSQAAHGGTMNQFSIEVLRPVLPISATATTLVVTALSNAGVSAGTGTSGVVDVEITYELLKSIVTT